MSLFSSSYISSSLGLFFFWKPKSFYKQDTHKQVTHIQFIFWYNFNLKKYFPFSQYPYSYLRLSIDAFIFVLLLWDFLCFSPCDHHLLDYVLTCIIFWTALIQEKQDTLTKGHVPYMLIYMLMFVVLWRLSILMLQIPATILVFYVIIHNSISCNSTLIYIFIYIFTFQRLKIF